MPYCILPSYQKLDQATDLVPVISISNNLFDIFLKAIKPLLSVSCQKAHVYSYLDNKSFWRCLILLLPGAGIVLLIYDYLFTKDKLPLLSPPTVLLQTTPREVKLAAEELYQQANSLPDNQQKEKFALLLQAAEENHPDAICALGLSYYYKDEMRKAVDWWRKGAGFDHANSCWHLGHYYRYCNKPDSFKEAAKWFKKASDLGYFGAIFSYAECLALNNQLDEAENVYRNECQPEKRTASYQFGQHFHYLGEFYENHRKDLNKALEYYNKAADEGSLLSINALVKHLEKEGEKSLPEIFALYKKGADIGYSSLMTKVAECYEEGRGTPKDIDKAKEYREKASKEEKDTLMRLSALK